MAFAFLLTACDGSKPLIKRDAKEPGPFPAADRPVASIVSSRWSNEEARDRLNEAGRVMDKADIRPGMTVADIGAGEGYYTIRMAARVGTEGRVLAQDIVASVRDQLAERVARERLDNVSVKLGEPADPKLPDASFDRVLMVHMYHEIAQPYEFLWRLRPSLKPDGLVVVVDANRPTRDHGTPPALLKCEFAAVGYTQVATSEMASAGGYMATFRATGPRPEPKAIRPAEWGDSHVIPTSPVIPAKAGISPLADAALSNHETPAFAGVTITLKPLPSPASSSPAPPRSPDDRPVRSPAPATPARARA